MGIHSAFQSDLSTLGLFSWDVCDNRLTGDDVFAALHGLSMDQVAEGVPVEFIINRMVDGDRERTAKEVHTAILTGAFIKSAFRVHAKEGLIRRIGWFGRCLKDRGGMPTQFTGVIFDQAIRNN